MALFSALQGIAPHLDAAMVLNVCEGAGLIVSVRDDTGRRLHYSDEVAARLGYSGSSADNTAELRYFDEHDRPLTAEDLPHERVRRSGEDVLNSISRIEGPAGSIWVQMSFTALAPGDGGYSVLGIGTDITVRREAEAVLERMATHDGLTGLLNRAGLLAPATRRFTTAETERGFAVAMLDIDHFKAVNDNYGHAAGDAVLATVATAIREALPVGSLAGRWGGEEFLVVLPEADRERAVATAERVRREIAATVTAVDDIEGVAVVSGDRIQVTASIGVAVASPATVTLEALIGQADEALYTAKRAGRDRVAA